MEWVQGLNRGLGFIAFSSSSLDFTLKFFVQHGPYVAAAYLETSALILLVLARMPNLPLNPKTFLVCFQYKQAE
jgi:hypothetical protein